MYELLKCHLGAISILQCGNFISRQVEQKLQQQQHYQYQCEYRLLTPAYTHTHARIHQHKYLIRNDFCSQNFRQLIYIINKIFAQFNSNSIVYTLLSDVLGGDTQRECVCWSSRVKKKIKQKPPQNSVISNSIRFLRNYLAFWLAYTKVSKLFSWKNV